MGLSPKSKTPNVKDVGLFSVGELYERRSSFHKSSDFGGDENTWTLAANVKFSASLCITFFVRDWLFAWLSLCACVHHVLVLPPQGLIGVCPKAWGGGGGDSGGCDIKIWRTGAEWIKLERRIRILISLWNQISYRGLLQMVNWTLYWPCGRGPSHILEQEIIQSLLC